MLNAHISGFIYNSARSGNLPLGFSCIICPLKCPKWIYCSQNITWKLQTNTNARYVCTCINNYYKVVLKMYTLCSTYCFLCYKRVDRKRHSKSVIPSSMSDETPKNVEVFQNYYLLYQSVTFSTKFVKCTQFCRRFNATIVWNVNLRNESSKVTKY